MEKQKFTKTLVILVFESYRIYHSEKIENVFITTITNICFQFLK